MMYKNIIEAIKANDIEAVKSFLPDQLELKDNYDWTPLHWACRYGNVDMVRLLLSYGADVKTKTKQGDTPLHIVCGNKHTGMAHLLVLLLLDKGADINAKNHINKNPISYSCDVGDIATAELLFKNGGDIFIKDRNGRTTLFIPCLFGHLEVSEFLVKNGVDPLEKDNKGHTALDHDVAFVLDKSDYEVAHRDILLQLRTEYLESINQTALDKSENTAALSSGWEMEM